MTTRNQRLALEHFGYVQLSTEEDYSAFLQDCPIRPLFPPAKQDSLKKLKKHGVLIVVPPNLRDLVSHGLSSEKPSQKEKLLAAGGIVLSWARAWDFFLKYDERSQGTNAIADLVALSANTSPSSQSTPPQTQAASPPRHNALHKQSFRQLSNELMLARQHLGEWMLGFISDYNQAIYVNMFATSVDFDNSVFFRFLAPSCSCSYLDGATSHDIPITRIVDVVLRQIFNHFHGDQAKQLQLRETNNIKLDPDKSTAQFGWTVGHHTLSNTWTWNEEGLVDHISIHVDHLGVRALLKEQMDDPLGLFFIFIRQCLEEL